MFVDYDQAADQAVRLSRTKNYPHPRFDRNAFDAFVADIMTVCNRLQVSPESLVSACDGEYCPTKPDLERIAFTIAESNPAPKQCHMGNECPKCGGYGWERMYALHTIEGGDRYTYTRKDTITEQQYRELLGKVDRVKQKVYDGVKRCSAGCAVPKAATW